MSKDSKKHDEESCVTKEWRPTDQIYRVHSINFVTI